MRIKKYLSADQETIGRFLAALGGGTTVLGTSKLARPSFFIFAHSFIREFIETVFFKKEELLIQALENCGFPGGEGPVGAMRAEQEKSREASGTLISSAHRWQAGDEEARTEVVWAASNYTSTLRQHLDRLNNLIFPLLEQNLSREDEHKIAEGLNNIVFEASLEGDPDKHFKLVEMLEEELSDWQ